MPPPAKKTQAPTATVRKTPARRAALAAAAAPRANGTRGAHAADALALLRADHQHIAALLAQIAKTRGAERKRELIAEACLALEVHAQVEEEIFYPALILACKECEPIAEARVEHAVQRELIEQLREKAPDDALVDARVKVLTEYVRHHVKEEQTVLFAQAREAGLDLHDLGERIIARKARLEAEPVLLDHSPSTLLARALASL